MTRTGGIGAISGSVHLVSLTVGGRTYRYFDYAQAVRN